MDNDDKLKLTLESPLSDKRSDIALENRIRRERGNTIEHIKNKIKLDM